jgi:phosphatidylserine/phosphatidylglycerophosphate/cardiolipin synthase-like enzyme
VKCAAIFLALAAFAAGCAQADFAGGSTDIAPADAVEDAAIEDTTQTDDLAGVGDIPTTTGTLPPGPVLELKANKDYMGGALAVIQTAQKQLDITEFETTPGSSYLAILVGQIKAAQARGVQVRVLMDDEIPNNAAVVADLKSGGVNAKLDSNKVRTHVKLIRSEQGLMVGSTNWSQSSLFYNNETNFLVRDAAANATMASYFQALWDKPTTMTKVATGNDPNVAMYSDGGYKGVVQPLIQAAKSRILLCTYGMNTDDKDVQAVLADVGAAVKRGVQVRVVLDVSPADYGGDPTINADAGVYLKKLGADVRNDPGTVITHAKFLVVDDTAVLGSNNWGHGGFFSYHEAGVKTQFAAAVAALVAYFEKQWATGTGV